MWQITTQKTYAHFQLRYWNIFTVWLGILMVHTVFKIVLLISNDTVSDWIHGHRER